MRTVYTAIWPDKTEAEYDTREEAEEAAAEFSGGTVEERRTWRGCMIYLCRNAETVCDGREVGPWAEEATGAAVAAATDVLLELLDGIDVTEDSFFANWHGGRFDQFFHGVGIMAYRPEDDCPELQAALEAADAAADAALDAWEALHGRNSAEFAAKEVEIALERAERDDEVVADETSFTVDEIDFGRNADGLWVGTVDECYPVVLTEADQKRADAILLRTQ